MLNYYFKTLYPIDMKTYESEGMGYKIKSVFGESLLKTINYTENKKNKSALNRGLTF